MIRSSVVDLWIQTWGTEIRQHSTFCNMQWRFWP